MALVRKHPDFQNKALIENGVANWNRHMKILDEQLAQTGAFVTGRNLTLADVVLGLSTHRWAFAPIDHAHLPAVNAYYERLSERIGFMTYGRNGIA